MNTSSTISPVWKISKLVIGAVDVELADLCAKVRIGPLHTLEVMRRAKARVRSPAMAKRLCGVRLTQLDLTE
jgi:hypothetical protein